MPSPSTSSTVMLSSPGAIPPKDPEGSAGADPAGAEGSPDGAELPPEEERLRQAGQLNPTASTSAAASPAQIFLRSRRGLLDWASKIKRSSRPVMLS